MMLRNRDFGNDGHPTQFAGRRWRDSEIGLGPRFDMEPLTEDAADRALGITWKNIAKRGDALLAEAATGDDADRLHQMLFCGWSDISTAALMNPNLRAESLLAAATGGNQELCIRIASSKPVRIEAARLLSGDSDHEVRYALARNPTTPAAILTVLADDYDEDVLEAVIRHGNATDRIRERASESLEEAD